MAYSVLFPDSEKQVLEEHEPDCFHDLNLDQIIRSVLAREQESMLSPLYYTPLHFAEEVNYRQKILQDLCDPNCKTLFNQFSHEIIELSAFQKKAEEDFHSGDPWRCHYLLYGHILDYSERYCRAIQLMRRSIPELEIRSAGLQKFGALLEQICNCLDYTQLEQYQNSLRQKFDREHYCMHIKNGTIRVRKYQGEEDLSDRILKIFDRFRQPEAKDYRRKLNEVPYADHVEAEVLNCLSRVYPELFKELRLYAEKFYNFIHPEILKFCQDIRFYISWLNYIQEFQNYGLPFCFPKIQTQSNLLFCTQFYDLALAGKIGNNVVKNDFYLEEPERILVITGPNQGGKTTFARAVGQIHYLASLGLCIPGENASILLTDHVLTHFECEETLTNQSGKLQDDLERLYSLLGRIKQSSLVIINEIFASTVYQDALKLGQLMIRDLVGRKAVCVIVTFMDDLAQYGPETVSLMSTVDEADPEIRTFKVIRKPPDGLAYAMSLANRHGLTYTQILRRISP